MIRVFISYRNETDGENAKLLYDCLDQEEKIEPELALEIRDLAIENAEKIANAIDSCNFFITFYTTKGKESVWVNQELGYAFNHVKQNRFKIIPIYNNRTDFEGFLTSESHNFYKGFHLNEEEPEETMEKIKKYFTDVFSHPIKLDFGIEEGFEPSHNFNMLKAVIWITNISSQKIRDATLDFVLPDNSPKSLNITGNSEFIKTQYDSKILPEFHSNKIKSTNNIKRINFLLNDILGLNAYEIPLEIEIPKSLENQNILFGVYVNIPLFGTSYYQVKMEKTGNNWKLSKFHLSNNPDEKIEITTK